MKSENPPVGAPGGPAPRGVGGGIGGAGAAPCAGDRARGLATHSIVIASFALLTILFTWPAFRDPTAAIPGAPGDNRLLLWDLWRTHKALDEGRNPLISREMLFPHRLPMVFHTNAVLHGILLYPLRRHLPLIAIYNLWAFATFVVGGWAAFLLAREVLKNDGAAFLAACVFTFSPYRMQRLEGHIFLLSTHWIPFFILFLWKLRRGRWRHALAAGAFMGLSVWTDLHYPVHLVIFTLATLAWWLGMERGSGDRWRGILGRLAVAALTALLLTLPLWLSAWEELPFRGGATAGGDPQPQAYRSYSARAISFFVPPRLHPLLGRWNGRNWENQVYLGLGVLALLAIAWRGRRQEAGECRYWLAMSIIIAVLAMGPVLLLASRSHTFQARGKAVDIPLPGLLLTKLPGIRMGRCPARFMGIGMLAFGLCAGFGMRRLIEERRWKTAAGLVALLAFEYLAVPFPATRVSFPAELRAIASKGGTVVDIPLVAGTAVSYAGKIDYGVCIYQIAHGRPRVGGLISRASDDHRTRLLAEPFLGTLLRLMQGELPSDAQEEEDLRLAPAVCARYDIRHIAILPEEVGGAAHRYVERIFPSSLERPLEDGGLWLELRPEETGGRQGPASGR